MYKSIVSLSHHIHSVGAQELLYQNRNSETQESNHRKALRMRIKDKVAQKGRWAGLKYPQGSGGNVLVITAEQKVKLTDTNTTNNQSYQNKRGNTTK